MWDLCMIHCVVKHKGALLKADGEGLYSRTWKELFGESQPLFCYGQSRGGMPCVVLRRPSWGWAGALLRDNMLSVSEQKYGQNKTLNTLS